MVGTWVGRGTDASSRCNDSRLQAWLGLWEGIIVGMGTGLCDDGGVVLNTLVGMDGLELETYVGINGLRFGVSTMLGFQVGAT